MAEQSAQSQSNKDGQNTTGAATSGAGDKSTQITMTPEQLEARLDRERAKFADYADLKAKAEKLDQFEESNKSEIQKAIDRATAAEAERDAARVEALRFKIATKHRVSDEDADLFLTGTDETTLTKQAERLAGRTAARRTNGNVVSREGGNQSPSGDGNGLREFTRNLFRTTT